MEGAALAMEKSGTDEEWKALNSVVIGEIYKGMEVGIKHVLANGKKALARRLADERRRERRVKRRQNGER